MTSLSICACLRWNIYLQSSTWLIGRIMYWPKTIWPRLLPLVVWYVYHTAEAAAARILIHGSASSTYVSFRLYVRTGLPSTWCIISTIAFTYGFSGDAGLVLITYSFSIMLFLNSWPRNFPPWSYVIYTGHRYQTSHIFSTKFAIVIAFLSQYCVTSNHPVTGYITVTAFKIKWYFSFLHIL